MSQNEIIATVNALLADAALGIKAKLSALAAGNAIPIATDFRFVPWVLAGTMQPATQVNMMTRPSRWSPDAKNDGRPHRDATAGIEIGYEYFGADPDQIQENLSLAATALAQVIDELPTYAAAHDGTVYDIEDPMDFVFGEFAGAIAGATSNGFICRITVLERSSQ